MSFLGRVPHDTPGVTAHSTSQQDRDSRDNRLLSLAFYDSAGMTWQKCVDACQKKGKNLAGIE